MFENRARSPRQRMLPSVVAIWNFYRCTRSSKCINFRIEWELGKVALYSILEILFCLKAAEISSVVGFSSNIYLKILVVRIDFWDFQYSVFIRIFRWRGSVSEKRYIFRLTNAKRWYEIHYNTEHHKYKNTFNSEECLYYLFSKTENRSMLPSETFVWFCSSFVAPPYVLFQFKQPPYGW